MRRFPPGRRPSCLPGAPMVAGVALALSLATGCRDEGPPAAGGLGVYVADVDGPGVGTRGRAGAWVPRAIEGALRASDAFAIEPAAVDGALPASVAYREVRTQRGGALRLELQIADPPRLASRLDGPLQATVELEREDGSLDLERDLPVALERAVAVLDAKVALCDEDPAKVAALLADADPELVLLALEHVTIHRRRDAMQDVLPLLGHEDPRVNRAAVECVGFIGSPEHVPRLLAAARLNDRAHTGRLYDALARLGGPQAAGFLAFAARNEDDPALAMLARQSLAQLELQGAEAPPAAPPSIVRGHR